MDLAVAFADSPDLVALFDAAGAKSFENAAWSRGSDALRDAKARIDAAVAAALASGESSTFEAGERGPGGIRCWYACTVSAVREGERIVGALLIARDVTVLKRTEERLRRSEQLMVDTQGVAHLGTWEWDVSEPNATWSAELYRIYGLTPEEYTPSYEQYLTKIHPDDRERVVAATNRVFHEHVPYSHDERIFRPDGSMRYLHTWAFPVLDDDGKLTKLVGVCQDITDRKLAEEEVLRANETLEKRVAERTRDLEAFNAMVTHDLRTPLMVISTSCALLDRERERLSPTALQHVERIERSATQMTKLVKDVLSLAHVGNSPLEITDIDLTGVSEDVVATLRQSAIAVPSMVVAIEPGLRCRGDAALVRTVLENLLGNAWKYSSRVDAPRIEVGATSEDGRTIFHVKDNGAGFDMKDAERLFTPFERLHKATDFEGTGVGLAAVRRIIERHGGRIYAKSAPGEGATFFFTFG